MIECLRSLTVAFITNKLLNCIYAFQISLSVFLLQDSLMVYARTQLNLIRGADDRQLLVEHLLDVIYKDLDQGSMSSSSMPR
jgi:ataxia telangiectasia mutated family protein